MKPTSCQTLLAAVSLCAASVLLTGCPKAPMTGAGAGSGAGAGMAGGAAGAAGGAGTGAGGGSPLVAGGAGTAPGTVFPALPSLKDFVEVGELRDVHFDFDQYSLRPQDVDTLSSNARWLKQNRYALVLIEGHADERGTNEYNLALGDRRAKATRDQLVKLGVEEKRITVISYGEERPQCSAHAEACWAKNRRAHFLAKP